MRAATNFPELTPRPNYNPIFNLFSENSLKFTERTTIEKTHIIYEKLKQILDKSVLLKKDSLNSLSPKKFSMKKTPTPTSSHRSLVVSPKANNQNTINNYKENNNSKKSLLIETEDDLDNFDNQKNFEM